MRAAWIGVGQGIRLYLVAFCAALVSPSISGSDAFSSKCNCRIGYGGALKSKGLIACDRCAPGHDFFGDKPTHTFASSGWTKPARVQGTHAASTSTGLSSVSAATMAAAGSVALSAAAGMVASKSRLLSGAGTMVTLLVAAMLSNIGISPASNQVYELCWQKILPLSLALLLLAPQQDDYYRGLVRDRQSEWPSQDDSRNESATKETISAVGVPFAIGSIGSIVGCIVSFITCVLGANNPTRVHSRILRGRKHFFWLPGHLLMLPVEAAVGAGCLCASYIGGSVNFFATARIVATDVKFPHGDDGAVGMLGSLFGSSASDLLVMALYFSTVTASLSSAVLRAWFPGRGDELCMSEEVDTPGSGNTGDSALCPGVDLHERNLSRKRNLGFRVKVAAFALAWAWSVIEIADALENRILAVPTPGIGCACIAVFGTISSRVLRKAFHAPLVQETKLAEIGAVASFMSDMCFNMLFAAIGSTANLGETIRQGGWHSASGFIFAGLALAVHIAIILGGSLVVQRFIPHVRLAIDEIMVASNALIGGPVTAAAFAAGMSTAGVRSPTKRRALVQAALFWGVVGYAVATGIGVALTRFLLNFVPSA